MADVVASAPNRTGSLAPYLYAVQQAEIDRRRKMAQALQQQAMEPIEQPTMPGVRISPVQGLAKLLQQFAGQYQQNKLDTQQRALDTKVHAGRMALATQ